MFPAYAYPCVLGCAWQHKVLRCCVESSTLAQTLCSCQKCRFSVFWVKQVLVGRNNKQNDELTNRVAKAGDVWMHARGCPGAHVLLRASVTNRSASLLVCAPRSAALLVCAPTCSCLNLGIQPLVCRLVGSALLLHGASVGHRSGSYTWLSTLLMQEVNVHFVVCSCPVLQ